MSLFQMPAPRKTRVLRGSELTLVDRHPSEPGEGAAVAEYLGAADGSVHLAVAIVELAPGAQVVGHLHPFEESFYVLSGRPLVNLAGRVFALERDDFGVAPITMAHAWANPTEETARLLRVYAPQPRQIGLSSGWGVFAAPDVEVPQSGTPVDGLDPRHNHVGHFDEDDMPPPASILMPGYHGPNIRNVSIRMMVDELLGARHHTLFVVQFAPSGEPALSAKEHFHPFEEIYYFMKGAASSSCDGDRAPIAAGDLLFAGVGASHGFSAVGEQPVRWIEAQAPLPPTSNGFFFHDDWTRLEQLA